MASSGKGFDFVVFQIQGLRRRCPFDRNRLHLLGFSQHLWMSEGEEAVEGMQGGKPLIACAHTIPARDDDNTGARSG